MHVVNHAQWRSAGDWQNVVCVGSKAWFGEMAKRAKPNAHLYQVRYVLDNVSGATDSAPLSRVRKLSKRRCVKRKTGFRATRSPLGKHLSKHLVFYSVLDSRGAPSESVAGL
jgi:hypothetical protein